MADRSKIIRHRDVIAAEFERISDRIAWLRRELAEAEEELRQVAGIAHEMMPRRATRQTTPSKARASGSTRVHLPPEGDK